MNTVAVLSQAVLLLLPMIVSLTVHEYAHARAARLLGDDTAERHGRLTLNPLAHIDPMGTVALPLMILISNGALAGAASIPFFGWAKPVPVDPTRFRGIGIPKGMVIVAAAGPLANLVLAILAALVLAVGWNQGQGAFAGGPWVDLCGLVLRVNVALFVFNLLPVYPLDGQRVLSGLLRGERAIRFERFSQQFGWMLLMGVIFFGRELVGIPVTLVVSGILMVVGLQ